jgi:hypothetical protein
MNCELVGIRGHKVVIFQLLIFIHTHTHTHTPIYIHGAISESSMTRNRAFENTLKFHISFGFSLLQVGIFPCNKNQQDALFTFSYIPINDLYMFRASLLLIIRRHYVFCIYSNWYIACFYVDWLLAGSFHRNPARSQST